MAKEWFSSMDPAEKAVGYAMRMAALSEIMIGVRMHRAQECEGHPLCPGHEAADRLNRTPPDEWGDLIITCLARIADQEGELEDWKKKFDQERERGIRLDAARTEAETRAARMEHEADKWLDAYRDERQRRLAAQARP